MGAEQSRAWPPKRTSAARPARQLAGASTPLAALETGVELNTWNAGLILS